MAKGKKRPAELPEYGTVMMKGVQYYRTRITDADGKRVAIYGLTREELYDRVENAQKKIAEVVFHRENPTVEEYCEKWLLMRSGTVRTNTLEGYARMVNRYIVGPIGQMYMDEVTTDDLRLLMVPLSKWRGSASSCPPPSDSSRAHRCGCRHHSAQRRDSSLRSRSVHRPHRRSAPDTATPRPKSGG